jgi:hypothetical protein
LKTLWPEKLDLNGSRSLSCTWCVRGYIYFPSEDLLDSTSFVYFIAGSILHFSPITFQRLVSMWLCFFEGLVKGKDIIYPHQYFFANEI